MMMGRFSLLAAANALLVLSFAGRSQAFVTVAVELIPSYTSTPPACSSTFIKNFESNLTGWVVNATRSISFLSDFKAPGGFHLTYRNNFRRVRERYLGPTTCSRCTSGGCLLSCAIGTCSLCQGSRRVLLEGDSSDVADLHDEAHSESEEEEWELQLEADLVSQEEDLESQEEEDEVDSQAAIPEANDKRRVVTADWTSVSTAVTTAVKPKVLVYGAMNAGGCLGDANRLSVSVTYLSNVPLDTTMSQAIVTAFGVPVAPPANAPTACCSMDFKSCVNYCGTTQTQCQTCGAVDAGWMPKGPPTNNCISRWNNCIYNPTGCCPGLQCLGDQWWKGCFYVPP